MDGGGGWKIQYNKKTLQTWKVGVETLGRRFFVYFDSWAFLRKYETLEGGKDGNFFGKNKRGRGAGVIRDQSVVDILTLIQ